MDYITDQSGRHILRLEAKLIMPDFAKSASVDLGDINAIPEHLFADVVRREFPIDSPGHTYLSYAYYKSAGVKNEAILHRMQGAIKFHQLTEHAAEIDKSFEPVKKAATPARYAVEIDFGAGDASSVNPLVKSGGVHGFYPISTRMQVETSAVELADAKSRIPLDTFVDGCKEIVKSAAQFGIEDKSLPRIIRKYGKERLTDMEFLKFAAEGRMSLTADTIYNEIAVAADANPDNLPMESYIELWKQADDLNGVTAGKNILDAYEIFNSGAEKSAMDNVLNKWTLVANAPVPLDAVKSASEDRIRRFFTKVDADSLIAIVKQAATHTSEDITEALARIDVNIQKNFLKLISV